MTVGEEVKLGDIAEFVRGITFKPDDVVPLGTDSSVACMRTKNVQDVLDCSDVWAVPKILVRRKDQLLSQGDILVSSANSWNLVGKCSWIPELKWPASFGGFVSVLRANPQRVEPRYLYRWFSWDRTQAILRSFGQKTTNISNLNIDRCLGMKLRLPALAEQRSIAAILDQADALRAKRREALGLLDELQRGIFIEMFGDLMSANARWAQVPVSSFVAGFESGKSVAAEDEEDATSRYRVLKVSAVTSFEFKPSESKAAPPEHKPQDSHFVRCGDLLFSRANTMELIGATAYVANAPQNLLLPDKLWRFVWHASQRAAPHFVHHLFRQQKFRAEIGRRASGSSGSMKNISQEKVLSIEVALPPLALQQAFSERIGRISELRALHSSALTGLDALFVSLQYRAFRGEL